MLRSFFVQPLAYVILALTLLGCSDNTPDSNQNNTSTSNSERYTEGVHYEILQNPLEHASDDIVITEFFWYGCPHCANFEHLVHEWNRSKPAGVLFEQSPAMWNNTMALHAKVFFIAQALDNTGKLHAQLFKEIMALHGQKDLEKHKDILSSVFTQYGLTKEGFYQQLESFKIKGQVSLADKKMKQAELKGTPLLIVNGKYSINNKSVKGAAELLEIANFLIEKEQLLAQISKQQ